jgi:hemolysin III
MTRVLLMKTLSFLREPINTVTHGIGAVMALIFTITMLLVSGGEWVYLIFGLSMMICYTASTLHHGVRSSAKIEEWLRRFDHSAIYLLIAGTYTPVLWHVLEGEARMYWLLGVWGVAAFGVLMKSLTRPPEWFSLLIYLGMSWFAIILLPKFISGLPLSALIALVIGGLCYTLGVPFYALGRRVLRKGLWTSHEIWHLFVLAGSVSHFIMAINL